MITLNTKDKTNKSKNIKSKKNNSNDLKKVFTYDNELLTSIETYKSLN